MTPEALDAARKPWMSLIDRTVDARLSDAAAHALAGDLVSAGSRLAELRAKLTGAGGIFEQARRDTYRRAILDHQRSRDPEIHQDLRHDPEAEHVAATARATDHDVEREIEALMRGASIELATADGAYGSRDPGLYGLRQGILQGWAARHGDKIKRWAQGVLSDEQVALHGSLRWLAVLPELR